MEFTTHGPFQVISSFGFKQENNLKGHQWHKQDLIKYAVYLKFSFKSRENGSEVDFNSWPFFRKLSIFIQSKNPNQCRIFHKKMMSDHSSVDSLLSQLMSTIHKFQEWEQHYELCLINLKSCLSRQRQNLQKELLKKNTTTKISIDFTSKRGSEVSQEAEQASKDKDLRPTATEYFEGQNESDIKPDHLQAYRKQTRPASSLFTEDEKVTTGLEMSWLSKPCLQNYQPLSKQVSIAFKDNQEKWKICQKTFQNYLGMLTTLMEGSASNY